MREVLKSEIFSNFVFEPVSNQIMVVAFQPVQLAQTTFLQKNQPLQNVSFNICNAEMTQSLSSLQKLEFFS